MSLSSFIPPKLFITNCATVENINISNPAAEKAAQRDGFSFPLFLVTVGKRKLHPPSFLLLNNVEIITNSAEKAP